MRVIKPQHFAALAAATAASVVVAAALFAGANRWSAGQVEGALLLPDLARQINTAAVVEVTQGPKKLTFERQGEQWKIKERSGYPASPEKVRALVITLAEAQLIEAKTAAKDRHKLLELEDPSAADAKSRLVRIRDAQNKPLAEVVLGKSRWDAFGSGRGGVYVRRLGDAQTWLATGEPKATLELRDWVTAQIFDTDQSKISRITLEHAGEEPLVVEKGDGKEQKFKLAQMPEGKKLKQGVTVDQIAQGFGTIDMEDVRALEATPAGAGVSVLKVEVEGGPTTTLRLRKDGDSHWLSLAAKGEGDAKKKADEINARVQGFEFKIPQWKADQIGKRRADLFETS